MKLSQIKELLSKITSWPWNTDHNIDINSEYQVRVESTLSEIDTIADVITRIDGDLIASAPTIIDQLIKQNEVMREALVMMTYGIATNKDWMSHDQLIEKVNNASRIGQIALEEVERIENEQ